MKTKDLDWVEIIGTAASIGALFLVFYLVRNPPKAGKGTKIFNEQAALPAAPAIPAFAIPSEKQPPVSPLSQRGGIQAGASSPGLSFKIGGIHDNTTINEYDENPSGTWALSLPSVGFKAPRSIGEFCPSCGG